MRVVLQRISQASVTIESNIVGKINKGLLLLVGITHTDTEKDVKYLAEKIVNLRIFEDEAEKMNLSLLDVGGAILSISQFTLYADTRKGRRPAFIDAAKPNVAKSLYEYFNTELRHAGVEVETGEFGANMDVALTNSGPVTIILDSPEKVE